MTTEPPKQRELQITNRVGGTPIAGVCKCCGELFRLESDVVDDTNAAQNELEQAFDRHKCGKVSVRSSLT
jgi:hypothetical protein